MAEKKKTINMKEYFSKFTPEQQKALGKALSDQLGSGSAKKPAAKSGTGARKATKKK